MVECLVLPPPRVVVLLRRRRLLRLRLLLHVLPEGLLLLLVHLELLLLKQLTLQPIRFLQIGAARGLAHHAQFPRLPR